MSADARAETKKAPKKPFVGDEANGATADAPPPSFLQTGDTGQAVIRLQQRLNALGFRLVVDGHFGPKTYLQVKAFQQHRRIPAHGVCDPETFAALEHAEAGR